MAVVVDTDVVSFIFKNDTRGALYQPHLDGEFMILSFMTLAELRQWSLRSNWGTARKTDFEKHLRRYSVQHSNNQLCEIWAEVIKRGQHTGKTIAVADAWVAATALLFQIPLVTHNATDYQAVEDLIIITEQ